MFSKSKSHTTKCHIDDTHTVILPVHVAGSWSNIPRWIFPRLNSLDNSYFSATNCQLDLFLLFAVFKYTFKNDPQETPSTEPRSLQVSMLRIVLNQGHKLAIDITCAFLNSFAAVQIVASPRISIIVLIQGLYSH